jgi:hypothetical protein
MSEPQPTPWREVEGEVVDANGVVVDATDEARKFVLACVNQHSELLAEIDRLKLKVAERSAKILELLEGRK